MNNYCNIYTINNKNLNRIIYINSEILAVEEVQRYILRYHRYDVINKCAQLFKLRTEYDDESKLPNYI